MGKPQPNTMVSQNPALRIEGAGTRTTRQIPEWKSRALSAAGNADSLEVQENIVRQDRLNDEFIRDLGTLIGTEAATDAANGPNYVDDLLTLRVDDVTFGYRCKWNFNNRYHQVFVVESHVMDEYDENDPVHTLVNPNEPRYELWFGPLTKPEHLGRYLNGSMADKGYSPRSTPEEKAPIPIPSGTTACAINAINAYDTSAASAHALISIARSLETIAAMTGGDK